MPARWLSAPCIALALLCLDVAGAARARAELALRLETIALTGQSAPGTNGARFDRFREPTINASGEVAFRCSLQGPGVSPENDNAVFGPDGASGLALIAREGSPAPGTAARFADPQFSDPFRDPRLNDAGQVALAARLDGTPTPVGPDLGIFGPGHTAGSLALVARSGHPAPGGLAGASFSGTDDPSLNVHGAVAFRAHLLRPGANQGIWRTDEAGSLHAVALAGEPAPGLEAGQLFDRFSVPILKDSGQLGFSSIVTGPGIEVGSSESIWRFRPDTGLELVVRAGAPNPVDGAPFGLLSQPVFDDASGLAFRESPYPSSERRIWRTGDDGRLERVARWGDPVPGAGEGVFYADQNFPVLNDSGEIAFGVSLQGPAVSTRDRAGLVASVGAGGLRLLFRAGDPVPGLSPETVFGGFFAAPALTRRGDLAVRADPSQAVVFVDRSGQMLTLAGRGGQLEVAPGDVRTVWALPFYPVVDDRRGVNERRELAFAAWFLDGSQGVFRARIGTRARIAALDPPGSLSRFARFAILADASFPVETIVPESVRLCVVAAGGATLGCVAAHASHGTYGIGPQRPDAFEDLVLAFERAQLAALHPGGGEDAYAVIEGSFADETFFWSDGGTRLPAP